MITESTIYWITRLDCFNTLLVILTMLSASVVAVSFICHLTLPDYDPFKKHAPRVLAIFSPLLVIFALGLTFLPTTKEMCAIKVIPALANNEKIQGIGDKALTLTNEWLDGLFKKAKEKTK